MSAAPAFALVGPSGVGKDSIIAAVAVARPDLLIVRRVVTRPADPTEPFEPCLDADFDRREAAGEFALSWAAHGLRYAIPAAARAAQANGRPILFNGSRAALPRAVDALAPLSVIAVSADPALLATRLAQRGREDAAAIAGRLAQADLCLPDLPGVPIHQIDNSGDLSDAVATLLALLPL
ncbi:MAG: phosphonate metabolism protein/1,5-bisphosphokinase (PRPP-forming) PhnN [Paracoccus sp. (in: a-proteobacteria)]|nr:phosphonate metabolism protein/1,5-bisphosphokinase (PRPP-forming) PhnN [Paracoccus sp. (in: a-proteobacteria)]